MNGGGGLHRVAERIRRGMEEDTIPVGDVVVADKLAAYSCPFTAPPSATLRPAALVTPYGRPSSRSRVPER